MQDAQVIDLFRALAVLEGVYYGIKEENQDPAAVVRYTEECTWMKCTDCKKDGCVDRYVDDVMDRVRSYDEEPPTADEAFLSEGQRVVIPPPADPHYEPLDMNLIQTQRAIADHLSERKVCAMHGVDGFCDECMEDPTEYEDNGVDCPVETTPAAVGCTTRCKYQTPKHRCMILRGGRMCWNPGSQCEKYSPLPQ